MGYQSYVAAPATEPPEAQSIRSMLHIARILAIIFGIIVLISGIVAAVFLVLFAAVWLVIGALIAILVYTQMRSIEEKLNARQYEAAKSQTLIWMILGLIFGIVLGIILLIAYIKFDPLISWQRTQMAGGAAPVAAAPAPQPGVPAPVPQAAPAPPPVTPPTPPPAPNCANCGRPTTYIAQYGRYYCYPCARYV